MSAMIQSGETMPAPQEHPTSMMQAIILAANNPQTDVEKMQAMMAMAKELRAEQARAAYADALSRFNDAKKSITANRTGHVDNKYADWPQMEASIRPWLAQCGLSLTHRQDAPVIDGGKIVLVMVYAVLRHRDGHSEEVGYPAQPNPALAGKLSPSQLMQQPITYAKRQTAAMILGLSTSEDRHDDDSHKVIGLSDDQLSTLTDLMAAWEPSEEQRAALLQWCRVSAIEDLPPSKFETVAKKLREKVAGKAA